MNTNLPKCLLFSFLAFVLFSVQPAFAQAKYKASGNDWAEWRGPNRDGNSPEKGLPEKWSIQGENLLWKVPYGGRSAPIVMGNRVFMFNSAGEGAQMQERVLCLDADTGKMIWEYRFNVYSSDVATRRIVGWSATAGTLLWQPTLANAPSVLQSKTDLRFDLAKSSARIEAGSSVVEELRGGR